MCVYLHNYMLHNWPNDPGTIAVATICEEGFPSASVADDRSFMKQTQIGPQWPLNNMWSFLPSVALGSPCFHYFVPTINCPCSFCSELYEEMHAEDQQMFHIRTIKADVAEWVLKKQTNDQIHPLSHFSRGQFKSRTNKLGFPVQ